MAEKSVRQLMAEDLWSEHPRFKREDWQYEVANGDSQIGYWEWVKHRLEMEEPLCKKCGTPLDDQGRCQDVTCPYSDRGQNETYTEG